MIHFQGVGLQSHLGLSSSRDWGTLAVLPGRGGKAISGHWSGDNEPISSHRGARSRAPLGSQSCHFARQAAAAGYIMSGLCKAVQAPVGLGNGAGLSIQQKPPQSRASPCAHTAHCPPWVEDGSQGGVGEQGAQVRVPEAELGPRLS
jgi:hypothetical protein